MARPLSNVDAAWLRMEDPTNLMMVTGILLFDGPLDLGRVRRVLEDRLLPFHRFHQRVREAPFGFGSPQWVDDPHFDLEAHLHRLALPAPADEAALQAMVGDLMSTPLDMSKPLWQIHIIDGYQGGSVFLARLHHCIADGIALIQLLLSLTDPSARPARTTRVTVPPAGASASPLSGALAAVAAAIANPFEVVGLAQSGVTIADTLQRLVLLPPDPPTALRGRLGVTKRVAWSAPVSLADLKAAGARHGATINDLLIAAVTGALREYLAARGEPVDELEIRAAMPVNLRPIERGLELGNSFGLVFVPLPIAIPDRWRRLSELQARLGAIKASAEAVVAFGVLNAIGVIPRQLLPPAVEFFGSKASLVLTNVPGPRAPLYLAGRRIANCMFWVPQSGHLGLGVSILSYAGGVMVGIAADAGLVPDPETIVRAFESEFRGLMMPAKRRRAPAPAATGRSIGTGALPGAGRPRKRARPAGGKARPGD